MSRWTTLPSPQTLPAPEVPLPGASTPHLLMGLCPRVLPLPDFLRDVTFKSGHQCP